MTKSLPFLPSKGLLIEVYRSPIFGDSAAGGITSRCNELVLVGNVLRGRRGITPAPAIFDVTEERPAVSCLSSTSTGATSLTKTTNPSSYTSCPETAGMRAQPRAGASRS